MVFLLNFIQVSGFHRPTTIKTQKRMTKTALKDLLDEELSSLLRVGDKVLVEIVLSETD